MTRYDSIVVGNDLVSEHWLAEQFPKTVTGLRPAWKEREEHAKPTPRSGLKALAAAFGRDLVRLRESGDDGSLRALHASVREALLIPGDEQVWVSERSGGEMTVPAVAPRSSTGTSLLVLEARDAASVEDLLDSDGTGQLLQPASFDGRPETSTSAVLSGLFRTEDAPALILVTAGAWLLLAERSMWPEGRWLAVDLATVLERADTRAGGELETVAALVGGESIVAEKDTAAPLLGWLEESVKHAVGVSKDLRDGVRESIELLASEVLRRRRDAGLPDDVAGLASDLTRQSLRYLYRILFLLYAEARPELGVLPVGAPEYSEGYGLDRLRELVLTELTSTTSQTGTHFYSSLGVLFRLVNDGYSSDDPDELGFEPLRADLFSRDATALIDEVGLGNACLQQVLSRLLLSKKQRGRDRGFVSYAQLGINQLGAVYEGLMSYSGSIARDHMVEVAKDGDPGKGSWVVPVSSTEGFDESWFVTDIDEQTGDKTRRTYRPGDFVFRLSGRERQRSASYYTPEVLTRCVVTHSLAELLDDDTPASRILELTVCEPALGSGAFLVEAVNQLADQYLIRRQKELNDEIPPEQYAAEKQKVKAYLALHNCYGVDLNATAVELAEITLWLDAMHPGLQAPWFGLHLRRGNSLIGARRESWSAKELAKRGWLTTVPTTHGLDTEFPSGRIHHFLLPAAGWGAVADTREAKELRPEQTTELKAWRRSVTGTLTAGEIKRLQNLSERVEMLWMLARRRLETAEAGIRRDVQVWGLDGSTAATEVVRREQIEESFADPGSAYRRLRLVMDAWAALWFWPVTASVSPPDREQWLKALEGLLGSVSKDEKKRGRGMWSADTTWAELDDAEYNEVVFGQMKPVADVLTSHPWLEVCAGIAEREGFFHWELDFAAVFGRGGFDLQVGNPPWVRPDWEDTTTLADVDPWFALGSSSADSLIARRHKQLQSDDTWYLNERSSLAGITEHLSSEVDRPILSGLRPDSYRCFMDLTWSHAAPGGTSGLIHPDSHFNEAKAGLLRRECYRRLRRHWQFRNERKLFSEIGNATEFGISIYSTPREPRFLNAAAIYDPATIDRSLAHDGTGPEPGIKDDLDNWNRDPHSARIINVSLETLSSWASLTGDIDTPADEARMLLPLSNTGQETLNKIAKATRFRDVGFDWTAGWNETTDRRRGLFDSESAVPDTWEDVILQGPQFAVSNPFYQQPNPTMRSHRDYSRWNLEDLPVRAIPRTSYQRSVSPEEFQSSYTHWNGRSASTYWRLAWRNMTNSATVRSLQAALIPPGPTHVHAVHSLTTASLEDLCVAAAMWSSIPVDYLVKVSGVSKVQAEFAARFPHPRGHPLLPELILRVLRLNCLTADYAPLWREVFKPEFLADEWTQPVIDSPVGQVEATWTSDTPLRVDRARRQAMLEIDALAAIMLEIDAQELASIYRTQFGVLRKYERAARYNEAGRLTTGTIDKTEKREDQDSSSSATVMHASSPVDRELDMIRAHDEFDRRLESRE